MNRSVTYPVGYGFGFEGLLHILTNAASTVLALKLPSYEQWVFCELQDFCK
jgi:hypothetical protein